MSDELAQISQVIDMRDLGKFGKCPRLPRRWLGLKLQRSWQHSRASADLPSAFEDNANPRGCTVPETLETLRRTRVVFWLAIDTRTRLSPTNMRRDSLSAYTLFYWVSKEHCRNARSTALFRDTFLRVIKSHWILYQFSGPVFRQFRGVLYRRSTIFGRLVRKMKDTLRKINCKK